MALIVALLLSLAFVGDIRAALYSRSYSGYCTASTMGTLRGVTLAECQSACSSVDNCLAVSYLKSDDFLSVCEGKSQHCSSNPWLDRNWATGLQWLTVNKVSYASDNPVVRWNQLLSSTALQEKKSPPEITRLLAVLHSAIREAMRRANGLPAWNCPARDELLVVLSASQIVLNFFPSAKAPVDLLVQRSGGKNCAESVRQGITELAATVATEVFNSRQLDNSANGNCPYSVQYGSQLSWKPTAPEYSSRPLLPCWGNVALFGPLANADMYVPSGPPPINSDQWVNDWREVFEVGVKQSSRRIQYETDAATLWDPSVFVAMFNQVVADVLAQNVANDDLRSYADVYYLANAAAANAAIVIWRAKYKFNTLSAVPIGPNLPLSSIWAPWLTTPVFPEYPAGHSGIGSAYMQILQQLFGDNNTVAVGRYGGATHYFSSLKAVAEENSLSRVFGGVHFRYSCDDALNLGNRIAQDLISLHQFL